MGFHDGKGYIILGKNIGNAEFAAICISSVLKIHFSDFVGVSPVSYTHLGNTEKPDVAAAKLLEGRVAILTDGSPFVLIVPHLLVETFQVSEDYYSRPFYASMTVSYTHLDVYKRQPVSRSITRPG